MRNSSRVWTWCCKAAAFVLSAVLSLDFWPIYQAVQARIVALFDRSSPTVTFMAKSVITKLPY